MNSVEDLVAELRRRLDSRGTASFFVNGGPGTGKSHVLRSLVTELPPVFTGSFLLHTEVRTQTDGHSLVERQMRRCLEAGYLNTLPPTEVCSSLNQAWSWVSTHGTLPRNTVFIVLVDVGASALDLASLATLFSSARYLETAWPGNGRLLCVIASTWDGPALSKHYHQINTSFPYTEGHNYVVWEGITEDAAVQLLPQVLAPEARALYARTLHELTGGNPAVMTEILSALQGKTLSLDAILRGITVVAQSGQVAQRLLGTWGMLLPESQGLIYRLLASRVVRRPGAQEQAEQLLSLGVVREEVVGGVRYLVFRSWYHEMLFRNHLTELGYGDTPAAKVQISELMPGLQIINREAYRVILEVENAVRSHFVLQAQLHREPDIPPLRGRLERYDEAGFLTDAQQRAEQWRRQSAEKGLPTHLSPLIAFCTTRDLAKLMEKLVSGSGAKVWGGIGRTMRALASVRDAVMHNQLIDEAALLRLYELRTEVYEALAGTEV